MIRSNVRYGEYMHYHLCTILPRETKLKFIMEKYHWSCSFSCTPVASTSVIDLVLSWAQMCCAVRTQWTTPLSLISSRRTWCAPKIMIILKQGKYEFNSSPAYAGHCLRWTLIALGGGGWCWNIFLNNIFRLSVREINDCLEGML